MMSKPEIVITTACIQFVFNCFLIGQSKQITVAIADENGNKSLKKLPNSKPINVISNKRL